MLREDCNCLIFTPPPANVAERGITLIYIHKLPDTRCCDALGVLGLLFSDVALARQNEQAPFALAFRNVRVVITN